MLLPLLLKTWRDRWRGFLAWSIGLVLITAVELYVYPSIRDSAGEMDAFVEAFPEPMREMFRMSDYTSGAGFLNVEMFSIIVPLVFIAVGASWGASATAEDEERGTADLLLTLPVGRTSIVVTKATATLVALAVLVGILATTLIIGSGLVDLEVPYANLVVACLMSGLLGVLYAALGLFVGAATGRRGAALGVAIGLAIAGFLIYSLAPTMDTFDAINPFNPFQWAVGSDPLTNGIDAGYALNLGVLSALLFAAAIVIFRRRDIRAE